MELCTRDEYGANREKSFSNQMTEKIRKKGKISKNFTFLGDIHKFQF